MAVFPTLSVPPHKDYTEEIVKPIIKSEFDGNYAQTRPRFTRSTINFSLKFKSMLIADKTTLQAFFSANSGSSFDWLNPTDAVTYTVRFAEDSLSFRHMGAGYYETTIELEQV